MQYQRHVHRFSGHTTYDYGHLHRYSGTTSPSESGGLNHTHTIWVNTTTDMGHHHVINVETGPGIPVEGGHVHHFSGATSVNGTPPHTHQFDNVTGLQMPVS